MRNKFLLAFFLSCFLSVGIASAEDLVLESREIKSAVFELYTSEGCSSCPPADHWFGEMVQSPLLWKKVIPVAFHVDYWNYLGWKDILSNSLCTERQMAYTRLLGITAYTPMVVLDGKEVKDWSHRSEWNYNLPEKVGKLTVERKWGKYQAQFSPLGGTINDEWVLHGTRLGFGIMTDVRAGENRGRKLEHNFAVLSYAKAPMRHVVGGAMAAEIELKDNENVRPERYGIAFWVSREGSPAPVQAVGGWDS